MYYGCCTHHAKGDATILLSNGGGNYLSALISHIFNSGEIPDIDPELLRAYGSKLDSAVTTGYGAAPADLEWNTPDYEMLTKLQNDVWQFSAAKTNTQLRDMGKALIGPDGKVRSFKDFKIAAQEIVGEQLNWLQTEYDTAVAGAQMAPKWVTIQANKEILPLLEFDAVIDDRTSTICRPLNKVIRPVDDPFWNMYYPPNHFNCRSTVRQLRSGEITPVKDIQYPEKVPDMFKVNLGKEHLIFPPGSAYYKDTPTYVTNNATLYMPESEQYITKYKAADGTTVAVNRKTDIAGGQDLNDLLKVGTILADKGISVQILPEIHASETELRAELLPGVKGDKNPDMKVDGNYAEVKTATDPASYTRLQKLIANAEKQADRVIILLEEKYSEDVLKAAANDRFKAFPGLLEIGFVTADREYIEFTNDQGHTD